jgi:gliding motility-associated-like protein
MIQMMYPTIQKLGLVAFVSLLSISAGWSQGFEIDDATQPPFTPENLITNFFVGAGIEIVNVQFDGDPQAVGFFKNAQNLIDIDRGLVMTTGRALPVVNVGQVFASTNNAGTVPDTDIDLQALGTLGLNDVARYTITFRPTGDTIRFRYVWASEEYPEYSCSAFNDVFGFFISGPGITGPYSNNAQNIAIIPGTNLPVTINNLHPQNGPGCPPVNEQFYIDNNFTQIMPVYDGFTHVFTAEAIVIPCEEYVMKLVIADTGDAIFDSGVFLEGGSFGSPALEVNLVTPTLDNGMAEGCSEATLVFSIPQPLEDDFYFDYWISGSATNGVDYTFIPDSIFIPAGETSISYTIEAFEDFVSEGIEFIAIDVQRTLCERDTFYIYIVENPLIQPTLLDTVVCAGQPVVLTGEINIPLPEPPSFTNSTNIVIDPINTPIYSNINVSGVLPTTLGPGVIRSVCINIEHNWLDDLDIYLIAPSGAFMELTTDNGSNGDNYTNTCFTPYATVPITYVSPPASGAPYTGDFIPEGLWEDLWGVAENPTNGTWRLLCIDDALGFVGTLLDWTITFEPLYQIYYEWSPSTGLSCTNCPNPVASPTDTTTYFLYAYDSYGCEIFDTVTVNTIELLEAPNLICTVISEDCLEFSWDPVVGALAYQVNVNGTGWQIPNGALSHTICGLPLSTSVTLEVSGIAECFGNISITTCATPDCDGGVPVVDLLVPPSCNGGSDGSFIVSASGPSGPFTFTLNGETNDTGLFEGLSSGSYDVTIMDALNCPSVFVVNLSQPAPLQTIPLLADPILCFGDANAVVNAVVSGGTSPYSYQWSNGDTGSMATNVDVGTITVLVTDANGCQLSTNFGVNQPPAIQLTLAGNNVFCEGDTTGLVTVGATGGVGELQFLWDANTGFQTTPQATGITAGAYTVEVTDENGCVAIGQATVTSTPSFNLNTSASVAPCDGTPGGSASVTVTGSISPVHFYAWDASAGNQTSATAINLPGGTYSVTVTNLFGCAQVTTVTVPQLDGFDADISLSPTSCFNTSDGGAELTITGGAPGFTYLWSVGGPSEPIRTNLPAGLQSVQITDANGCFQAIEFVVDSPDPIVLSASATDVSCFDGTDGTATVSASGGVGAFTYAWEDAQDTPTATNLGAGTYSVTVTDGNGCQNEIVASLGEPDLLQVQATAVNALCAGTASGTLSATASGGAGGYSFLWSNTANTANVQDVPAGSYSVVVTDANGCTATAATTVAQPQALSLNINAQNVSCSGDPDGSATATVSGGTMPYQYIWSNNQTTATASNLAVGTYSLVVVDANDCVIIDEVTLTSPNALSIVLVPTNVLCNGGTNGGVIVQIAGGTAPFNYNWSNNSTASGLTQVPAGTYSLTITDANDCEDVAAVTLTEPEPLSATLGQTDALCHNGATGIAQVNAVFYGSNSAPLNNFTYQWNSNPPQFGATAQNLNGGQTYTVTVTDASGCTFTQNIQIGNPAPIQASILSTAPASCFGSSDGQATVQGGGGVAPYSYVWASTAGGQQTATATNLAAGAYQVTVTDDSGCEIAVTANVNQPTAVNSSFSTERVACFGGSDGRASVNASGGTPPYSYSWNTGANTSANNNLIAGWYNVSITDANGCLRVDSVQVFGPENPLQATAQGNNASCFGREDGSIQVSANGGTPPYRYSLNGLNFNGSSLQVAVEAGAYNVWVEDAKGCQFITGVVSIEEPERIELDLGPDLFINYGEAALLNSEVINGQGDITYQWTANGTGWVVCDNCPSTLTTELEYTTTYFLLVSDESGCRTNDKVVVYVNKNWNIAVPTAFSPNGDGQNDRLLVHGTRGARVLNFQVFDRWGEMVYVNEAPFLVNDPTQGWDGNFRGQEMNSGVFIWNLEVEYEDGNSELFKGSTTLIR